MESEIVSGRDGALGVVVAGAPGFVFSLALPGFPAVPPLPAVAAGLAFSCLTGLVAATAPPAGI